MTEPNSTKMISRLKKKINKKTKMKTNNNLQMDPTSIFNNFDLIFGIKTSEVVLSLCGPRPLTLFHTWNVNSLIEAWMDPI